MKRKVRLLAAIFLALGITGMRSAHSSYAATPVTDCPTTESALSIDISNAGSGGTVAFNCASPTTIHFDSAGGGSGSPITIGQSVTLDGSGSRPVTVDGGQKTKLFIVNSGTMLTVSHLTLQHGSAGNGEESEKDAGSGGAILSNGTLTVNNSAFTSNSAPVNGGAIAASGGLTVTSSTFSGNSATSAGSHSGAIDANDPPGGPTTIITGDTFTSNNAGFGGAMAFGTNNPVSITNSTLTGNSATSDGGALYTYAPVSMSFSTVASNTGGSAIAFNTGGPAGLTVAGSILDNASNCGAPLPITDKGSNLTYQGGACNLTGSTDKSADPQLGALASNGGPTQTQAPASNSPAVGAGTCTDVSNNPVRTDQRGVSRPVSACTIGAFEADQANDTWANALTLNQTSGSYQVNQTVSQHIYVPTQERWYRFQVTPGSEVHITYQGDPGAVVSLHSDMQAAYNSLTTPTNAAVESVRDAPSGYLPSGYLPSGYLPSGYLPSGYLPSGYLPSGYLPSGYLPSGYLPSGYLPSGYLPSGYLPSGYLPSGYLPGPYSGSVWDSLLAISATPNSSIQTIDRNTWSNFGSFYVRVAGPADRTTPFSISVTETGGLCANVTTISATPPSASSIPTGLKSLILWDPSRIAGTSSDLSTLGTKLGQLANRPEVQGVVIDLSQIPGIDGNGSAQQQADTNAACPPAKNVVANDIKSVIQAYRAQNPGLGYIVLVGDDHSIPFFRYPDPAGLAPESQYFPPVADSSASQAGLRDNYVLGQDEYGASVDLPRGDHSIPIPDLAVGRLVSTAAEVSHMLDVYTAANGTISPSSSLVTGYDFVADAASNAQAELAAGTNATPDTLIQPQGTSPSGTSDPPTWTAADLRQKLFGTRHDIIFLAGHFSAGNLLASDYTTQLAASEVASSTANLTNALVLALGCHGGYNIPGGDAIAGVSPSPDWPEALAEKGATLLATTGYAYGDTVLTEYGEHLFDNYVHQLRMGSGAVAVGQAAVAAKKEYLASHADLGGIDEKTLLETTLYGLPMLGINMPGQRIGPPSTTSIVAGAQPVATGPGAALQLAVGQTGGGSSTIDVQPSVTSHTVPLTNTADNSTVMATYLSGRNGTVAHPLDPIFPLQLDDVHVVGQILRGVGFWGGTYTDATGVTPLTVAPATDNSVGHPAFFSTVRYPTQMWSANDLDAVSGGDERLVTTPAQYRSTTMSDGSLSTSGTLRQFSDLRFRLYYLPGNWTTNAAIASAAVGAASNIASVSATSGGSQVTFSVRVLSSPAVGTQDVWVTYTDPSAPGTWTSVDLTQPNPSTDPTLWQATATLPVGIQFMVQAVNGAGLVSLSTNSGAYYSVGPSTPPSLTATSIALESPPASGGYQQTSTFQVQLSSNGTGVQGQQVALQLGGQEVFKNTDVNGNASFNVALDQPPGSYTLSASFAGSTSLAASQAQPASFQINPGPTTLSFTTPSASVDCGDPAGVVATLTDVASHPLAQRSVLFTASGNGQTYQKSVITDYAGRAQLGGVALLPVGTYSVIAAYGGQIANGQVTESDPNYQSSHASGASLTVSPANPALTTTPGAAVTLGSGARLSDSATLSNACNPTGTITFYLFAPGVTPNPAHTNNVYSDTVTVSGNGIYSTATGTNPGGYVPTAAGTYQWVASYSGDGNNNAVASTFTSEPEGVQYGVKLLYKAPMSGKVGSSVPIKIELVNAAGQNVSSSGLAVQALCVVQAPPSGANPCLAAPSGFTYSNQYFTYVANLAPGGGYQFNVKTTGLSAGTTYQLLFRAAGEPSSVFHVEAGATFSLTM